LICQAHRSIDIPSGNRPGNRFPGSFLLHFLDKQKVDNKPTPRASDWKNAIKDLQAYCIFTGQRATIKKEKKEALAKRQKF